jgi:hypothetical protein
MQDTLAIDVLDRLLEGCQVVGFDWRYLYVNEAVAAQSRRQRHELVGRTMMECFPGIEATPMFAALRRCMHDRNYGRMDNEFQFPDGSKGWFELRFIPVPEGVCVLSLDVTASKVTAHDVNNHLSVILSYSSLLVDELTSEDPKREDALEIMRAGQRAAELTRQLLPSSRRAYTA